jgi:low temperature requirement protein LtrA
MYGGASRPPLELLYDLTFVVAFGTAANHLAHFLAEGHLATAIGGFSIAVLAVVWAWMNYSWFASAYDTDDWLFRVATLLQMVGVIVWTLGLEELFESLDHSGPIDARVMVIGYVVIRLPMVVLWSLAARHDPERAPAALQVHPDHQRAPHRGTTRPTAAHHPWRVDLRQGQRPQRASPQ